MDKENCNAIVNEKHLVVQGSDGADGVPEFVRNFEQLAEAGMVWGDVNPFLGREETSYFSSE